MVLRHFLTAISTFLAGTVYFVSIESAVHVTQNRLHLSTSENLNLIIRVTLNFYSRVTIKESSISKLGSVCRRIYRIFSHAYYHHRRIYDQFEVCIHISEELFLLALCFDTDTNFPEHFYLNL